MGLISKETLPLTTVRFSLRDIEAQAREKLSRSARDADALVEQAQQHVAEIAAEAQACGFAEGVRHGLAQGGADGAVQGRREATAEHAERLMMLIQSLDRAAEDLSIARQNLETMMVCDAVELALAVAARVIKHQAAIDPQVLLRNVREALNLIGRASDIRIALHPSQRDLLLQVLPQLQLEHPGLKHAAVVEDETILPGGCRVFTPNGKIDADLESQLERIARELMPGELK
jgi:flagellar assembly protein FliH